MKNLEEAGRETIAILLATYQPDPAWLEELLVSLNAQTYPALRLYVRDDGSTDESFETTKRLVRKTVTRFPAEIARNEENHGSRETFACLTAEAQGRYFAYCDQDDVWLPEKLTRQEEAMRREKAALVCSDVCVIDGEGRLLADSITALRKRHVFLSGEGLAPYLLARNFVMGCTLMVDARLAKAALPFVEGYVHDQWIAAYAALHGKVISLKTPLLRYRQHEGNQTGLLKGVATKADYYALRIRRPADTLESVRRRLTPEESERAELERLLHDLAVRDAYYTRPGLRSAAALLQIKELSRSAKLLELLMPLLSEKGFSRCVALARSGRL